MVTTSDVAMEQAEFLSQWNWQYIVVDDPVLVRREEFPSTIRSFSSQHRIFSTALPIVSSDLQIWLDHMLIYICPNNSLLSKMSGR